MKKGFCFGCKVKIGRGRGIVEEARAERREREVLMRNAELASWGRSTTAAGPPRTMVGMFIMLICIYFVLCCRDQCSDIV